MTFTSQGWATCHSDIESALTLDSRRICLGSFADSAVKPSWISQKHWVRKSIGIDTLAVCWECIGVCACIGVSLWVCGCVCVCVHVWGGRVWVTLRKYLKFRSHEFISLFFVIIILYANLAVNFSRRPRATGRAEFYFVHHNTHLAQSRHSTMRKLYMPPLVPTGMLMDTTC